MTNRLNLNKLLRASLTTKGQILFNTHALTFKQMGLGAQELTSFKPNNLW